jgi:uncharacterized membrane protein YeaQ/YmgE (transglycosylase-associated protein family)
MTEPIEKWTSRGLGDGRKCRITASKENSGLIPVSLSFVFAVLLETVLIGMTLGALAGILAAVAVKVRVKAAAVVKDALLGVAGPLIVLNVLSRLGFQNEWLTRIAFFAAAIILPVWHEFHRSKQSAS